MKRVCSALLILFLLTGCGRTTDTTEKAMNLRSEILQGAGCEFLAEVTADYSQMLYKFKMRCKCDSSGNIDFEVLSPESISGITGKMDSDGGKLTFDDKALLFSTLADGRLSPVSGPWVMMRAIRAGYLTGCSEENGKLTIHIDDSYQEDALQVIVQTDEESKPVTAEIFYRNVRVLTILVEDFLIL